MIYLYKGGKMPKHKKKKKKKMGRMYKCHILNIPQSKKN